ncbi:COX15/CtaA family protein [Microbacterium sp. H1-D42]|uniref:COX15/CtaA family protein n=1 Tax=Microbacterium sp. H1-D42 TaxID=2925844 RepID=UPI001F538DC4|nr:COX15/CtaA family protein [Microbacterium sp. H1-D42]UNK72295.1 COX15/CtaA family protein [Microbacterium sp. H1-D42]
MTDIVAPETTSAPTGWRDRFFAWMPTEVDARVRVFAWLSFIFEVFIIGTGGAVRLTGSGLGCSEWPLCTPESLVPTPEQGIHGIIEFGNRTITGVVGILAIVVLLFTLHIIGGRLAFNTALKFAGIGLGAAVIVFVIAKLTGAEPFPFASAALLLVTIVAAMQSLRTISGRKDLPTLAWIALIGVIAQAFVGGITVLTGLNPFIVGFHYVASLALVCVTAAYLVRMHEVPGPRERAVPKWFAILTHVTGLALVLTITFGVLTTGSGPHSGDANVIRDGFDASVLAHVHSWPGYILTGLVLVLAASAWILRLPVRNWLLVLIVAIGAQVLIGVWQARDGLPALLVGIHMVLAALAAATYTVVVLKMKRSTPSAE